MPLPTSAPSYDQITGATAATTASTSDVDDVVSRINGHSTDLNELGRQTYRTFPMTTDPGLGYFPLTQINGFHGYTSSIASGRLRYTASATNTDQNFRVVMPSGSGVMGDSEVRSTWFDSSVDLTANGTADEGRWQPGHCHRVTAHKQVDFRGAVDGATLSNTLVQIEYTWIANQFIGAGADNSEYYVTITSGTGFGQTRKIAGNAEGALIVTPDWTTTPTSGSRYQVWTYNTRAITWTKNIAFAQHWLLNCHVWEGSAYTLVGFIDMTAYLNAGVVSQFPWYVKTRVVGRTADIAIWKGADSETAYGTANKSGSVTLPASWDQAGMSGLYLGHLKANDWFDFDDLSVVRL